MAISLGRDGSAPPFGGSVITATYTEEAETIDVTSRENAASGYKTMAVGFTTKTWEVECYDPNGLIAALEAAPTSGSFTVMSVNENVTLDGPVTYTVSIREA